jgi:hypothetical protein
MAKTKRKQATPLPLCDDGRCPCQRQVTKARNRFFSHECAQAASRTVEIVQDSFVVTKNVAKLEKLTTERVRTPEDLFRVCEIDPTQWDVVSLTCKASQQASVPRATRANQFEKWTRESTEPVLVQMFHVSATLKPKSLQEATMRLLSEKLVEDIRAEVRRGAPAIIEHRFVNSNFLFEFSPFDLHMGKLAWGEETVTDYDSAIATGLFNASLEFLLGQALKTADGKLERILCVFGNDVSHIDSKRAQTTAGTPMDADTRFIKIFRRICAVHRHAVDRLVQVAPVDCVIVPGNHDEVTSFHLGEILATRYESAKHVTVDNSARMRKYYEFGTNLFGFSHGDAEKVSELPLLMARERSDVWHQCQSREWHIGHKHISEKFEAKQRIEQDLFSDKGIRVRRLTSLSAHDAWHTKHGYTDRRACESFVFHKTAGFTSHDSFNVDHFSGRALSK